MENKKYASPRPHSSVLLPNSFTVPICDLWYKEQYFGDIID